MTLHRDNDGTLAACAWPGGYQMVYYTRDGLTICPPCANRDNPNGRDSRGRFNGPPSDPVIAGEVYWEGPDIECEDGSADDCMRMIPSAYGDPDRSGCLARVAVS